MVFALSFPQQTYLRKYKLIHQYKIIINDKKIEIFLQNLYQYDQHMIETHQDPNEEHNNFIVTFFTIFDPFILMEKKLKTKIQRSLG